MWLVLGKSTLASKLYHSSELSHLRSRAWVCVSEDYDITHILRKLIKYRHGQARHAIYNGIGEYLNLLGPNSDDLKVRSLALTNKTGRLELEEMKMIYNRFKYLKVLDLTSVVKSEAIPEAIGDLILLKFLGLMGGSSLVIPESIGKLKKLQTLCGSNDYKFPREISELKELRHLIFEACSGSLHISSHQKKLQTLRSISHEEWFQIDTVNLTNLHTLFINSNRKADDYLAMEEESVTEFSLESMANLTSLRTLVLHLGIGTISTMQPLSSCKHLKGLMLTAWIKDPDSITELTLGFTSFEQDPMPILGSLPNLTALSLGEMSYSGHKMVCSKDVFPCLQVLKLDQVGPLEELQVDDGALLSLKAFEVKFFGWGLDATVPQRITSLPAPQEISLLEFWASR